MQKSIFKFSKVFPIPKLRKMRTNKYLCNTQTMSYILIDANFFYLIFYTHSKDIPYSFRATILFLTNTFHKEGLWGLWRGNSATMARIIPYAAVQFTSHEQWKKFLAVDKDQRYAGNYNSIWCYL